jgi:hypothetical protein
MIGNPPEGFDRVWNWLCELESCAVADETTAISIRKRQLVLAFS